jgi:hypothetical protein
MIPVDVGVELVQDAPAALRRPRAKNIAGIKFYLRFGEGGCHRFADSLHEHLNGRSANVLNQHLPLVIRAIFIVFLSRIFGYELHVTVLAPLVQLRGTARPCQRARYTLLTLRAD